MDEAAYRATRVIVTEHACVFEKALLARCVDCRLAARHALAEREAIGCRSPPARADCGTLFALLRERSAFALKISRKAQSLPHALILRLQCGGLTGLAQVSNAEVADDVHALVAAAQDRYGSLLDMPWPGIVAAVVAWRGRSRHRPR
jgi:hypothetical protein